MRYVVQYCLLVTCCIFLFSCERLQQQLGLLNTKNTWMQRIELVAPTEGNLKDLPLSLQKKIRNGKLPPKIKALEIDARKIRFLTTLSWKKIPHRDRLLLRTLERVAYRFPLPSGTFLISTDDSIDQAFDWPVLSFASPKTLVTEQKVVLMPDCDAQEGYEKLFSEIDQAKEKFPWEKKLPILFWRGSSTGIEHTMTNWLDSPRVRFLNAVKQHSFVDAGFTNYVQFNDEKVKEAFAQTYPLKDSKTPADSLQYRYLADVDGNSCSYSRVAWILYSNSLLLKHESENVQWYYPMLQEGMHYLKIDADFKNIPDQINWAEQNPNLAKKISGNAHALAIAIFSQEAILDSILKAFYEYKNLSDYQRAVALSML